MGTLSTNGVIKAANVFANDNQVLHAGNWSTYCAAASHTHDDLIIKKKLDSTGSNIYSTFLLYTFTTNDTTNYSFCSFDIDVIDRENLTTDSYAVQIRCRPSSSLESSFVVKKINSYNNYAAATKNIIISCEKNTSTNVWTYYVYLDTTGVWRAADVWFRFTALSSLYRTWSGESTGGTITGTVVSKSQPIYGETLPTEYCYNGMMFFKT